MMYTVEWYVRFKLGQLLHMYMNFSCMFLAFQLSKFNLHLQTNRLQHVNEPTYPHNKLM